MRSLFFIVFSFIIIVISCKDNGIIDPGPDVDDLSHIPYDPIEFELVIPSHFPKMLIPADNPLTIEGVDLGRHLFYDPILSSDSTMSCSSCHLPAGNFTDNLPHSPGVTGELGKRSSMSLLNIGFNNNGFFWDGRAETMEDQALAPVEDPVELHENWDNVESKLRNTSKYPEKFRKAFGIGHSNDISRELAVKAIAQFERTLISSGNSKYDKVIGGEAVFTDLELDGHDIFFDVHPDRSKHAECGHCHNAPLFTTNEYFNNGLEQVNSLDDFPDTGRGNVTNLAFDNGTFRVPGLRNIEFSAPFMHDGRFQTLEEVIDHYSTGGHIADNLGAVMRPLSLTAYDRSALLAFIQTLQDHEFMQNPAFHNPFQ